MRWLAFVVGLLSLGTVLSAATEAPAASQLISFGPLEFLKPILLSVVNENTLLAVQNNIGSVALAVLSGNPTNILNAVLDIVDPTNVSPMWDEGFRQQIRGLVNGLNKAVSSGVACFGQSTRFNLNNFTSNFVGAMEEAFAANRPSSTAPSQTGLAGFPTAALGTAGVIFDVLRNPGMRQALMDLLRGSVVKFGDAYECARGNSSDVATSWQLLTAQLNGAAVATPTTTPKASSSFWGIF